MPKISIIVPVYNVEKYLTSCLDSIIGQTFKGWECLVIDDGSSDSSGVICDEYARKDNRIKVFHKNNGGVSSARNLGLDIALGQYVIFMDSDDLWLSTNCLSNLDSIISKTNADIIRFDYEAIDENGCALYESDYIKYRKPFSDRLIPNDVFLSEVIKGEYFSPLLLFRRSFADNLRFNEKQKFLEDMDFIVRMIPLVQRCYYTTDKYYGYRKLKDSASQRGGLKNVEDSFSMCYAFHKYASSLLSSKLKEEYDWYSIKMYVWTLRSIAYNEINVNVRDAFTIIDIEAIRTDVMAWSKAYTGHKTVPSIIRIPSRAASYYLMLKYKIIRLLHKTKCILIYHK